MMEWILVFIALGLFCVAYQVEMLNRTAKKIYALLEACPPWSEHR